MFVLSNVVCDLTVDNLVHWHDLMPDTLDQVAVRCFLEGKGVPLSRRELYRCFKEEFRTENNTGYYLKARREQAQAVKAGSFPNRIFFVGKTTRFNEFECPVESISVRYRLSKQTKQWSEGLVPKVQGMDPREQMERTVGPIHAFEIIG